MIPMLTLSIPGDDVAAVLMGAFMIQGITPGPTIFIEHSQMIYSIFAGFLLTDLFLLIIARSGFKFWTKVASVPRYYIFPCVTVFAFAGAFTVNQSMTDILILLCFMVFGYGMRTFSLNPAAFVIGFILTPFLEENLDQAIAIVGDQYHMFFATPFAWVFTALGAFSVYSTMRQRKKQAIKEKDAAQATAT